MIVFTQDKSFFIDFQGRVFSDRWTRENVARWLREQSEKNFLRGIERLDKLYADSCSCIYSPDKIALTFTRDDAAGQARGYHLSLYFVERGFFVPMNSVCNAVGLEWLKLLYPENVRNLKAFVDGPVINYILEVQSW